MSKVSSEGSAIGGRSLRVLFVEDSVADVELCLGELRKAGFEVTADIVQTPQEFAERLCTHPYDIVLADYNLLQWTGMEALEHMQQEGTDIPFILVTGTLGDETAVECIKRGATDYVIKDRLPRLPLAVRSAMEEKTLRDERKAAEAALYESNRRLEEALAELKATQQQVLQQERLRALGQMASGIAHDFNNALSAVLGFSELLLDHPEYLEDKPKVTRYLCLMNTAAQDARNVVRRLREFYRSREANEVLVPVDMNQLVHQAISLTQPRWKDQPLASGITIHIHTDLQDIPSVAANDADVREVLTNLIFNAVDAMPEGGTLTIRTRPERESVVVEVSDTGVGMTEDVRHRCLEPFFSTKGERGTGLGLAMVYGIIRRHHGTLDLDSEPGRGTTVVFRLPVATGQHGERRQEAAEAPSRQLRILVVDDEPTMRELLTEFLTGDGHAVETATNGREALEKFHGGWFDFVVTDRGMHEMSGEQLAAAIKRAAPDKPVIVLTGFGDLMEASGEKPVGVDLVVCKPVTQAALRQAVAKVTAV